MNETRDLERAIECRMRDDNWHDMPKGGVDTMAMAFTKVLNYIDSLREKIKNLEAVIEKTEHPLRRLEENSP